MLHREFLEEFRKKKEFMSAGRRFRQLRSIIDLLSKSTGRKLEGTRPDWNSI